MNKLSLFAGALLTDPEIAAKSLIDLTQKMDINVIPQEDHLVRLFDGAISQLKNGVFDIVIYIPIFFENKSILLGIRFSSKTCQGIEYTDSSTAFHFQFEAKDERLKDHLEKNNFTLDEILFGFS